MILMLIDVCEFSRNDFISKVIIYAIIKIKNKLSKFVVNLRF